METGNNDEDISNTARSRFFSSSREDLQSENLPGSYPQSLPQKTKRAIQQSVFVKSPLGSWDYSIFTYPQFKCERAYWCNTSTIYQKVSMRHVYMILSDIDAGHYRFTHTLNLKFTQTPYPQVCWMTPLTPSDLNSEH